jgi:hypothetical protein
VQKYFIAADPKFQQNLKQEQFKKFGGISEYLLLGENLLSNSASSWIGKSLLVAQFSIVLLTDTFPFFGTQNFFQK